jgi:hypothetical protein
VVPLSCSINLMDLPQVKALYDAANRAAALLPADNDAILYDWVSVLEAHKLLVDALIAFREA